MVLAVEPRIADFARRTTSPENHQLGERPARRTTNPENDQPGEWHGTAQRNR